MRKTVLIFTIVLLALLSATSVFAAADDLRVYDYAQLFTERERQQLQETIDEHIANYNMDIVVLTISDDNGKTSRAFADDFYDDYGFGFGQDLAGVLFLINMDRRDIYISTSGRMIDILNDARIDELLDAQYDLVKNDQYFDAMMNSIDITEQFIDAGPVSGQYRYHEDRYLSPLWIIVSLAIGVGTAFIVVFVIRKQYSKEFVPVPYDYRNEVKLHLAVRTDDFVDKQVTRTYDPPPPPSSYSGGSGSSSSGSQSSTHTSSSGSTHGGGGRSF